MKGKVAILIASILLLGAAAVAVGLLAKNGPDNQESARTTPTPTENRRPTAKSKNTATSEILDTQPNRQMIRALAEQYIAAVNAKDEAAAAQFTCRKKTPACCGSWRPAARSR